MQQLEKWFRELKTALEHRSVIIDQGEDPVFFLVYEPEQSLEIYRELPHWENRLVYAGWTPRRYDLGSAVEDYIVNHPDYTFIVDHLRDEPDDVAAAVRSLANFLMEDDSHTKVESWVADEIAAASKQEHGLLLITGVELLHPYLQIGRIEQALQGQITCPVVVFYPGVRTSAFGLKYLRFYEADGNYRSRHIGGTAV